jgi:hypothetical protein
VGVERGRRKGAGPRRGAPGALPAAGLGRRQLGRDHLVLLPAVVAAIAPAHAAALLPVAAAGAAATGAVALLWWRGGAPPRAATLPCLRHGACCVGARRSARRGCWV